MDYGHYIKRDDDGTRYHEQNGGPQCAVCNRLNDGEDKKMRSYVAGRYGEDAVIELERLKRVPKHWTRSELLDLIKFYRTENKKFDLC